MNKNKNKAATNLNKNVKVVIFDLDDTLFEVVTQRQEKASLVSQEQWVTSFDVRVKEQAYGAIQTLKANVTFDSSDGGVSGTFLSTTSAQINIPAKPAPPVPSQDFTLYIIIGAVAAVAVVLGVVIARR